MALLDRLTSNGADKIPVHTFWAAMAEFSKGEIGKGNIVTYFGLDQDSEDELDWLIGKYTASTDKPTFIEWLHVIFLLAEGEAPGYTTTTLLQARINRLD